jgi:hypothetical protein
MQLSGSAADIATLEVAVLHLGNQKWPATWAVKGCGMQSCKYASVARQGLKPAAVACTVLGGSRIAWKLL